MPTPLWIVIIAVAAIVCFLLGINYRKKVAEREIASAEEEAKRIINESIKSAESKKREALVEAKEEIHKSRSEYEREVKERPATSGCRPYLGRFPKRGRGSHYS